MVRVLKELVMFPIHSSTPNCIWVFRLGDPEWLPAGGDPYLFLPSFPSFSFPSEIICIVSMCGCALLWIWLCTCANCVTVCVRCWRFKEELHVCWRVFFYYAFYGCCYLLLITLFLSRVMLTPTLNLLSLPLLCGTCECFRCCGHVFESVAVGFLFSVGFLCLRSVGLLSVLLVLMDDEGEGRGWFLQKWRIYSFSLCNSPTLILLRHYWVYIFNWY